MDDRDYFREGGEIMSGNYKKRMVILSENKDGTYLVSIEEAGGDKGITRKTSEMSLDDIFAWMYENDAVKTN